MPVSKNRQFAKIANDVNTSGTLTAAALSSDVSLGATVYDSAGLLPSSGMSAGDQAWSGNRLYISNGSGWYNIALVNANPRFVSITDSDGNVTPFALATDGTPTTITLLGADSDGVDVTYSYTKDSDFDGLATITGSGTEYTITPLSEDSATALSGTITFKVSDGISFATSVNTFNLTFSYTVPIDYSGGTLYSSTAGTNGYISMSSDGLTGCIIPHGSTDASTLLTFSTAWDASTITKTGKSKPGLSNYGVYNAEFSRDGLHLLTTDGGFGVKNHTLTTPFDITSISSTQNYNTSYSGARCVSWANGGFGFIYRRGFQGDTWFYVPLSTAYDFSSAGSASSKVLAGTDEGASTTTARNAWLGADGSYIVYNTSSQFRVITLSTPYDMSTAFIDTQYDHSIPADMSGLTSWAPSFDGTQVIINSSSWIRTINL